MSKKVKDTKGWLLVEHNKSIEEINITEPGLEKKKSFSVKDLKRNKTFTEKAMIVIQYILLTKGKKERYENVIENFCHGWNISREGFNKLIKILLEVSPLPIIVKDLIMAQ